MINFDAVRNLFVLEDSHLFLHTLLGGPVVTAVESWEEGTL